MLRKKRFFASSARLKTDRKWHEKIDEIAAGLQPVSYDSTKLFPWESLRSCDHLLRATRKLSEVDRDTILCQLVNEHYPRVTALAACSHMLSFEATQRILSSFDGVHGATCAGTDYFQAFVAASHNNYGNFSANDETWASVLVGISRDLDALPPALPVVQRLLNKWCTSPPPKDARLRVNLEKLTLILLQNLNTALQSWKAVEDWEASVDYAATLFMLNIRRRQELPVLEAILDEAIPLWLNWAEWIPAIDRIQLWDRFSGKLPDTETNTAPVVPHSDGNHFQHLVQKFWKSLGPDFDEVDHVYSSTIARTLGQNELVRWLESNGLAPGIGVLVASLEDMQRFVDELFSIVDLSCDADEVSARLFLSHLCRDKQLGLDQYTLQLWHLAMASAVKQAPSFTMMLMFGDKGDMDSTRTLIAGLKSLEPAEYWSLREYLKINIAGLVSQVLDDLKLHFFVALRTNGDWLGLAQTMLDLYEVLQKSHWLLPEINASGHIISTLTMESRNLCALHALHESFRQQAAYMRDSINSFIIDTLFAGSNTTKDLNHQLVQQLHILWMNTNHAPYRPLAMTLALLADVPVYVRSHCISELHFLTDKNASKLNEAVLLSTSRSPHPTQGISRADVCRRIVRAAAAATYHSTQDPSSWRVLVRHLLKLNQHKPETAQDSLFTRCNFIKYQKWIHNLYSIFDSVASLAKANDWLLQLQKYRKLVDILRELPGSDRAVHWILTGCNIPAKTVLRVLGAFEQESDKHRLSLMGALIRWLDHGDWLHTPIFEAIAMLTDKSGESLDYCRRLILVAAHERLEVAAVQLEIWVHGSSLSNESRQALKALALALQLPPTAQPEVAREFFARRVSELMSKAKLLEESRSRLRRTDRAGVAAMLVALRIDESTRLPVEDELMDLPQELLNVVGQAGDNDLELQFPLSAIGELRRTAMGLETGETLLVRIRLADDGKRQSFCVHTTSPNTDWSSIVHSPSSVCNPLAPDSMVCQGRQTRIGYVIGRRVWKLLHRDSDVSLENIYRSIEKTIKGFGKNCLVCDKASGSNLYRSAVCKDIACSTGLLKTDLELRLTDLRLDSSAVALLLASVHAAATTMSTKTLDLLPGRPERLSNNKTLLSLINSLPFNITNGVRPDMSEICQTSSVRVKLLLSWICSNSYKGFLVSATPGLKIPNMPNVLQFVLADNSPDITAAFAKHDLLQPRKVLFHGTSLDRLFAILSQGLQVLSQTPFQTHGAAYGNGIYLAENPATAVGYAKAVNVGSGAHASSNRFSPFVDRKVLLGVEYAGEDARRSNGIHVATDPTKVLLRYIFLLPPEFVAPVPQHVVPAMLSNFHTLRSGAKA